MFLSSIDKMRFLLDDSRAENATANVGKRSMNDCVAETGRSTEETKMGFFAHARMFVELHMARALTLQLLVVVTATLTVDAAIIRCSPHLSARDMSPVSITTSCV